ncbi:MAG: 50S ribosomal protein L20 [Planctomycetota bacterium]
MARVSRGPESLRKKKRTLKKASGFRGARHRLIRTAKETLVRSLVYSFRDRKKRGTELRRLWTIRINAAARARGMTYGRFIHGLKLAAVTVDRKMLADLAVFEPAAFDRLVEIAKAGKAG